MTTAVNHLRRALRKIEKGWCQHFFATKNGNPTAISDGDSFCSIGAIITTANGSWLNTAEFLRKVVGSMTISSIASWNDSPVRTKEDVIKAYKQAINLARRKNVDQSPA